MMGENTLPLRASFSTCFGIDHEQKWHEHARTVCIVMNGYSSLQKQTFFLLIDRKSKV